MGVAVALIFEQLMQLGDDKHYIRREQSGKLQSKVAVDHGRQYRMPVVSAGDIPVVLQRCFQVSILMKADQKMRW